MWQQHPLPRLALRRDGTRCATAGTTSNGGKIPAGECPAVDFRRRCRRPRQRRRRTANRSSRRTTTTTAGHETHPAVGRKTRRDEDREVQNGARRSKRHDIELMTRLRHERVEKRLAHQDRIASTPDQCTAGIPSRSPAADRERPVRASQMPGDGVRGARAARQSATFNVTSAREPQSARTQPEAIFGRSTDGAGTAGAECHR